MKKKISFDYDEENGLMIAQLRTSKGTFFGTSCKHPEDPFPPSYSVGMNIAEARAHINLCNSLIAEKKIEMKGLKRLLNAIPKDKEGYVYALRLFHAIEKEILDLTDEKRIWKHTIDTAIESRSIYLRSRTTNKEDKAKYLKELGEAIHNLGESTKKGKKD